MKCGEVKSSTPILTQLLEVIGQARNATTPFEAWKCLITDEILYNIVQHTNQYITNQTLAANLMPNSHQIEIKLSLVLYA
jgi:hypothetical protein